MYTPCIHLFMLNCHVAGAFCLNIVYCSNKCISKDSTSDISESGGDAKPSFVELKLFVFDLRCGGVFILHGWLVFAVHPLILCSDL